MRRLGFGVSLVLVSLLLAAAHRSPLVRCDFCGDWVKSYASVRDGAARSCIAPRCFDRDPQWWRP